ncbi:membrane protein FxsA [Roseibium aquae]|uniref:Membrane protein FxsA n=1 Tax=Roseibium aquae TaxID=1323746 RepID=A0A916TDT5_9HYPH|nr:FxsA family protein [Roseibium aquae]GGB40670.1 membrane protein FxsA [Roseibium aquae]
MGLYIVAAIILLPLIEIAVFIAVGDAIGILPTVLLTVLTAVAGTFMLRQQGLSLVTRMQSELQAGLVPETDMLHGAMIVLASILLLIPGFVTDAIGLLLFIPPVRGALARFIVSRVNVTVVQTGRRGQPGVVDLDEEDWAEKTASNPDGGPKRISPWADDDTPERQG